MISLECMLVVRDRWIYRSSDYFTRMWAGNCDETRDQLPASFHSETRPTERYIVSKKNINLLKKIT